MTYGNAAIMSQRKRPIDAVDDFPTPPWAVRALISMLSGEMADTLLDSSKTVLDPCCNRGYIEWTLKRTDVSAQVTGFDKYEYPRLPGLPDYKPTDFLTDKIDPVDVIITNPPFNLAEQFIHKSLEVARSNVFILARIQLLEGRRRYDTLFSKNPPHVVMPFTERVTMWHGRVSPKNASATMYAWFHWQIPSKGSPTIICHIPPKKKEWAYDSDYQIQPEDRDYATN